MAINCNAETREQQMRGSRIEYSDLSRGVNVTYKNFSSFIHIFGRSRMCVCELKLRPVHLSTRNEQPHGGGAAKSFVLDDVLQVCNNINCVLKWPESISFEWLIEYEVHCLVASAEEWDMVLFSVFFFFNILIPSWCILPTVRWQSVGYKIYIRMCAP